jgi:hypothetical protein
MFFRKNIIPWELLRIFVQEYQSMELSFFGLPRLSSQFVLDKIRSRRRHPLRVFAQVFIMRDLAPSVLRVPEPNGRH